MDAATFLDTLTDDILQANEYSDLAAVRQSLRELSNIVKCLESASTERDVNICLQMAKSNEIVRLLLGINSSSKLSGSKAESLILAQLTELREMVGMNLKAVIAGIILDKSKGSRNRRRSAKFPTMISKVLNDILGQKNIHGNSYQYIHNGSLTTITGSYVYSHVIYRDIDPILAIRTIYLTDRHGRLIGDLHRLVEIQDALRQSVAIPKVESMRSRVFQ
jgi:hypothetical protein